MTDSRSDPSAASADSEHELEALRREKAQLLNELEAAYLRMEGLLAARDHEIEVTYAGLRASNESLRREIGERQLVEEKLKASLKDKEALLREVHHRVKNNLQVITSLLDLQSSYLIDERAQASIADSRTRVLAMVLVHEKLHGTEDLAHLDIGEYIEDLAFQVMESLETDGVIVDIKVEADPINLDMDRAIPCGLVLVELVTNSLKHAFSPGQRGEIRIELRQVADEVVLRIGDNGVGLPEDFDLVRADSLGMRLIAALSSQLQGTIELRPSPGTVFELVFPLPKS